MPISSIRSTRSSGIMAVARSRVFRVGIAQKGGRVVRRSRRSSGVWAYQPPAVEFRFPSPVAGRWCLTQRSRSSGPATSFR